MPCEPNPACVSVYHGSRECEEEAVNLVRAHQGQCGMHLKSYQPEEA